MTLAYTMPPHKCGTFQKRPYPYRISIYHNTPFKTWFSGLRTKVFTVLHPLGHTANAPVTLLHGSKSG